MAVAWVVLASPVAAWAQQSPWRRLDLGSAAAASGSARTCVVACPADTNIFLAAFERGGVHRSIDGGVTWTPALAGWNAPGASGFVFDPVNPRRVLGLGSGGPETVRGHGLYESLDAGATWRQIHVSSTPFGGQLALDPASFDRGRQGCQRLWLVDRATGQLRRSVDGGRTWRGLDSTIGNDHVVPAPHGEFLYLGCAGARNNGVLRSSDGGNDFYHEFRPPVSALAVSANRPNAVWAIHGQNLSRSLNSANGFTLLSATSLPREVAHWQGLTVSPLDARRMMVAARDGRAWFSLDGGLAWQPLPGVSVSGGEHDPTLSRSWGWFSDGSVWLSGGDGVWVGSLDRVVFAWRSGPAPQAAFGGTFQFAAGTDSVLLPLKKAQAAYTPDAGVSWELRTLDAHNAEGGAAAALAVDHQRFFIGHAIGHGPRRLLVSANSGAGWSPARHPGRRTVGWRAGDVILSHPTNSAYLFAPGWRSLDGGATWHATPSCDVVYTIGGQAPYQLVGRLDKNVMISTNLGDSWLSFTPSFGGFTDVALDQSASRGYFAAEGTVKTFQSGQWTAMPVPTDQFRERNIRTVAIDPADARIIYAGGRAKDYLTSVPVVRSVDGGRSWHGLVSNAPQGPTDGPREVVWMRVHPKTRELWVSTDGFGLWVASPPQ